MKLVVVGCGGFVGSHLLDRLLKRNDVHIEGWDPDVQKIFGHLGNERLTIHRATCDDPKELNRLEAAIAESDAVLNLAAICNPSEYNTRPLTVIRANYMDVLPIVDLCSKYGRWLIHVSTSEIYGRTLSSYSDPEYSDPNLFELAEDSTPLIMGPISNQRWTYATAKQLMERYVFAHHKEHGMPFTVIRPLNFFGPRMDFLATADADHTPRVLACFMTALLTREPMKLVDGGNARRTIVSVEEAVDAFERMLDRPEKAQNQFFNLGNPANEVTIAELAQQMRECYAEITGDPSYKEHPIHNVSSEEFYGEGYEDCDRRMPDISHATHLLGWRPQQTLKELLLPTMLDYHERFHSTAETMARRAAN